MNNNILGDNNRRKIYDPNLASRLNKDAEISSVSPIVKPETVSSANTVIDNIFLDTAPALDGQKMEPENWINYWKDITDGRIMASAPSIYAVFRKLYNARFNQSFVDDGAKILLNNFRSDLQNTAVITSTVLKYNVDVNRDRYDMKMMHNYGCKNPDWTMNISLNHTKYGNNIMDIFIDTPSREFVQACFGTYDDPETIIQTLEFMSAVNRNRIYIRDIGQDSRDTIVKRHVVLGVFQDSFTIDTCQPIYRGTSYGVRYCGERK